MEAPRYVSILVCINEVACAMRSVLEFADRIELFASIAICIAQEICHGPSYVVTHAYLRQFSQELLKNVDSIAENLKKTYEFNSSDQVVAYVYILVLLFMNAFSLCDIDAVICTTQLIPIIRIVRTNSTLHYTFLSKHVSLKFFKVVIHYLSVVMN